MQARQDDPDFERFIRESRLPLLGFLAKMRIGEEDSRDIAQEAATRLLRYRQSEPPDAWRALLYRIAINVVRDRARRERLERPSQWVDTTGPAASAPPSPEQHVIDQQALARVRAAILELPARRRAIYLMQRMDDMSYSEIARHLGISVKAVEKQMSLALRALREVREKSDGEPQ